MHERMLFLPLLIMLIHQVRCDLCERLVLENIESDELPVLAAAGVYSPLVNVTYGDMPVLKQQRGDLLLHYNNTRKSFYFGSSLGGSVGLGFTTKGSVVPSALQGTTPFSRLVDRWFYMDHQTGAERVTTEPLRLRCVTGAADQRVCATGVLEFSDTLRQETGSGELSFLNELGKHFYTQVEGLYAEHRPVYKRNENLSNTTAYLYHLGESWLVGPTVGVDRAYMFAQSLALTPELITTRWQYLTRGSFQYTDAGFRCYETAADNLTSCAPEVCGNGGNCYMKNAAVFCECPRAYAGARCETELPTCERPQFPANTAAYVLDGLSAGGVAVFTCRAGFQPHHFYSVCRGAGDQVTWQHDGACSVPTTTTRQPWSSWSSTSNPWSSWSRTSTPRPSWSSWSDWDSDDDGDDDNAFLDAINQFWVMPTVLCLALLVQILGSLCVYLCVKSRADDKKTDRNLDKLRKTTEEIRDNVGQFSKNMDSLLAGADALEKFEDKYGSDEDLYSAEQMAEYNVIMEQIKSARNAMNLSDEPDVSRMSNRISALEPGETAHAHQEPGPDVEGQIKVEEKQWFDQEISYFRYTSIQAYLSVWLWAVYMSVCGATDCRPRALVLDTLFITGAVFLPLCYLWVLLESIYSNENEYLTNLGDVRDAYTTIESIRQGAPSIGFRAECYHYETRTRIVSYTDANGNHQTRTETYQEKVVTHRDSEEFHFRRWTDHTDPILRLKNTGLTLIRLEKYVRCGDRETTSEFNNKYEEFCDRNRHKDTYVDFDVQTEIPAYVKRLAAYSDPETVNWWVSKRGFWAATLLGFSWPWRVYFKMATHKTGFDVVKHIFCSPAPVAAGATPGSVQPTAPQTTYDAETHVQPPSYEAAVAGPSKILYM